MPWEALFSFPKDKDRRDKWISAIRRESWTPTQNSKVCSDHFLTGKRTLVIVFPHLMHTIPLGKPSTGPLHPDYVPSVFSFTKSAQKGPSSRYARAMNRSKLSSIQSAPVRRVTSKKGTAKQGKGLLPVVSTNVDETQVGENEGMQQDEGKTLVRERESEEIDGVMKGKGQNLVEAQERVSEESDVVTITTLQYVDEMQVKESEEIDWMTVTEEMEQNMEETRLRRKCIEQTNVNHTMAAEDMLDDMSTDVDKSNTSEEIDQFIEQDLPEGVLADVEKTICDEFDQQVQDDVVGVLMNQLEMKEIKVGELQIENEKLLQANMELSEENCQLKGQIIRVNKAF